MKKHLPVKLKKKVKESLGKQSGVVDTSISSTFDSQNPFVSYEWIESLMNNKAEYGTGCIDKIRIKIPEGKIIQSFLTSSCIRGSHYINNGTCYIYNEVPFTVLNYGRGFNTLDVNPSKFPSFKKFRSFCKHIYGSIKVGEITRLDCSALLPSSNYPVQLFELCCYVERKRKHHGYADRKFDYKKGKLSGVDWGGYPHKVQAYDKDSSPHYKGVRPINITNFEVQIHKKHIVDLLGITNLDDLPLLMKKSPFKRIHFADVFRAGKVIGHSDKERFEWLMDTCKNFGLHNTRARIQKQTQNYYRDYQKFTIPLRVSSEHIFLKKIILKSFRKGIRSWLGEVLYD